MHGKNRKREGRAARYFTANGIFIALLHLADKARNFRCGNAVDRVSAVWQPLIDIDDTVGVTSGNREGSRNSARNPRRRRAIRPRRNDQYLELELAETGGHREA